VSAGAPFFALRLPANAQSSSPEREGNARRRRRTERRSSPTGAGSHDRRR
jgi:hypothetical protein